MKKFFELFFVIALIFTSIVIGFSISDKVELVSSFLSSSDKYFIIEFDGLIFESDKQELLNSGVEIISYNGNNSFLTKFSIMDVKSVESFEFVKSVSRFKKVKSEFIYNSKTNVKSFSSFTIEKKQMFRIHLFDVSVADLFVDEVLKLGGEIISNQNERFVILIEESKLGNLEEYEEINLVTKFTFNNILNEASKTTTKVYNHYMEIF